MTRDEVAIEGLRVSCVIGAHPWERRAEQEVVISVWLHTDTRSAAASDQLSNTIDYAELAESIAAVARGGRFELIETLGHEVAALCTRRSGVDSARVRVRKPGAIPRAEAASVTVTRPSTPQTRPSASAATRVLGVINLAADSRVTESVAADHAGLTARARRLHALGCDVLELGARSTNPRSDGTLDDTEEIEILRPAVSTVLELGFRVGVETWSPRTALWALDAGASMIDYTARELPDDVCRQAGVAHAELVLCYLPYSDPSATRGSRPVAYDSDHATDDLLRRAQTARAAGAEHVCVDPNTGILHPDLNEYEKVRWQLAAVRTIRPLTDHGERVLVNCPRKESVTSRIIMAELILRERPAWIRSHDPEIVGRVRAPGALATAAAS